MVHKGLVVNRDSTAIPAREKVSKKEGKKERKPAKKRGRPAKTAHPQEPTVMEKQAKQEAETSLEGIDKECTWGGARKTAKGKGTNCILMSVTPDFLTDNGRTDKLLFER
jgi:hypothetical protein